VVRRVKDLESDGFLLSLRLDRFRALIVFLNGFYQIDSYRSGLKSWRCLAVRNSFWWPEV
jgi:hypothetical protein